MKKEETYYDLLKIPPTASISEIVSAYHVARNAFSRDSLATYSLFSQEEAEEVLKKLEEAYLTLSNLDRRRHYDRTIGQKKVIEIESAAPTDSAEADSPSPSTPSTIPAAIEFDARSLSLRQVREELGMSLEDVAQTTKIPMRYLLAIEEHDLAHLPARVYLQGFVTNLVKTYRLELSLVKHYLETLVSQDK